MEEVQRALNQVRLSDPPQVDSWYGPQTVCASNDLSQAAVRWFQQVNGLFALGGPQGIVGPETTKWVLAWLPGSTAVTAPVET